MFAIACIAVLLAHSLFAETCNVFIKFLSNNILTSFRIFNNFFYRRLSYLIVVRFINAQMMRNSPKKAISFSKNILKFLFFSFYVDKNTRTLVCLSFSFRKYRVISCCISQPVSSCLSLVYSHSKYLSVNYKFVISFKVVYFNKGIDLSFFISK